MIKVNIAEYRLYAEQCSEEGFINCIFENSTVPDFSIVPGTDIESIDLSGFIAGSTKNYFDSKTGWVTNHSSFTKEEFECILKEYAKLRDFIKEGASKIVYDQSDNDGYYGGVPAHKIKR